MCSAQSCLVPWRSSRGITEETTLSSLIRRAVNSASPGDPNWCYVQLLNKTWAEAGGQAVLEMSRSGEQSRNGGLRKRPKDALNHNCHHKHLLGVWNHRLWPTGRSQRDMKSQVTRFDEASSCWAKTRARLCMSESCTSLRALPGASYQLKISISLHREKYFCYTIIGTFRFTNYVPNVSLCIMIINMIRLYYSHQQTGF